MSVLSCYGDIHGCPFMLRGYPGVSFHPQSDSSSLLQDKNITLAPTHPTPFPLLAFQLYVSVVSTFCRGANSSTMLVALYTEKNEPVYMYETDLYTHSSV